MGDERDAGWYQLGPSRVDLDRPLPAGTREPNLVVRPRRLAVLEFRLRDGRAEVHIPERRRFEAVREAPLQEPQEGDLRDALRAAADRGVGHRPVHAQAEVAPEVLEGLFVLGGEFQAQLDEVGPGDRDGDLLGPGWRNERGIVGERGIAAHAEVVLHAALGWQPVVVPPHRVEHLEPPHSLVAGDHVGVGVGEHVPDVQRAAHGGGRRVDRVHLPTRAPPVEPIDAGLLPARLPVCFETLERGLLGDGVRAGGVEVAGHDR